MKVTNEVARTVKCCSLGSRFESALIKQGMDVARSARKVFCVVLDIDVRKWTLPVPPCGVS
jgi:hypothetical protein